MLENQTVKDRLILFIKSLNIGQGAFEKQTGLSNGYVNNIRVSIQPDKLQKIALQFPQLNAGWLITGEGDMLKLASGKEVPADNISIPLSVWAVISNQADSLRAKDNQLDTVLESLKIKDAQTSEVIAVLKEQLKKEPLVEHQGFAASVVEVEG